MYMEDLLEGEKKIIVFAHHQDMLDALCEACEKKVCLCLEEWYYPSCSLESLGSWASIVCEVSTEHMKHRVEHISVTYFVLQF